LEYAFERKIIKIGIAEGAKTQATAFEIASSFLADRFIEKDFFGSGALLQPFN
jgi:hypothetical protein